MAGSTLAPSRSADAAMNTTLRVYNTLTKRKEEFKTLVPGKVGMYLCGPTVYKPSHIGHMVGPVIFDAIKRYLTYRGYQVTLVVNITDVDDKLIQQSIERGITMADVAREMTADYMANLKAMGVDGIDHFPKATDHIQEIVAFIERLIARGFAYETQGDVYFDVGKDRQYGKLSNRTLESLQGEGGSTADRKRSVGDFALWKQAKPGEPSWTSPWGAGRPGWHIECSVMSYKILGESFDIHGGGLDLVFPHHENEIAQSECLFDKPMASYWFHNGLMQAADEAGKVGGRQTRPAEAGDQESQKIGKISKSTGARPFRELLAEFQPETLRFFLLSTHYRSPIAFSTDLIISVHTSLERFYRYFKRFERVTGQSFYTLPRGTRRGALTWTGDSPLKQQVAQHRERFLEAMDDDFNTGGAISHLFDLLGECNRFVDANNLEEPAGRNPDNVEQLLAASGVLAELSGVLGLFRNPIQEPGGQDDVLVGKLMALVISIRNAARTKKDFATADQIRNALKDAGIALADRSGNTEWTREG